MIRSFRVHGDPFILVSVTAVGTIRPKVLDYWRNAPFVAHEPGWLTMDLYPGGGYADQTA